MNIKSMVQLETLIPNEGNKYLETLDLAYKVALDSSCMRRKYGCLLIYPADLKKDVPHYIISSGHNFTDCANFCQRNKDNSKHNHDYSNCRSIHAEKMAIRSVDDFYTGKLPVPKYDTNIYEADQKYLAVLACHDVGLGERLMSDYEPCSNCAFGLANAGVFSILVNNKNGYKILRVNKKGKICS